MKVCAVGRQRGEAARAQPTRSAHTPAGLAASRAAIDGAAPGRRSNAGHGQFETRVTRRWLLRHSAFDPPLSRPRSRTHTPRGRLLKQQLLLRRGRLFRYNVAVIVLVRLRWLCARDAQERGRDTFFLARDRALASRPPSPAAEGLTFTRAQRNRARILLLLNQHTRIVHAPKGEGTAGRAASRTRARSTPQRGRRRPNLLSHTHHHTHQRYVT